MRNENTYINLALNCIYMFSHFNIPSLLMRTRSGHVRIVRNVPRKRDSSPFNLPYDNVDRYVIAFALPLSALVPRPRGLYQLPRALMACIISPTLVSDNGFLYA